MQFFYKGYVARLENGIFSIFEARSGRELLRKRIECNVTSFEVLAQYGIESYIFECLTYQENYKNKILRAILTDKQYAALQKQKSDKK